MMMLVRNVSKHIHIHIHMHMHMHMHRVYLFQLSRVEAGNSEVVDGSCIGGVQHKQLLKVHPCLRELP